MGPQLRWLLWLCWLSVAGCDCGQAVAPIIGWPASGRVPLESELLVTADETGVPVLLPDRVPAEEPPVAIDEPGVWATSNVHAGIWYAEVVLGDVDPETPLPLVVMLHGLGDRPRIPGGPFGGTSTPLRAIIPRGPLRRGDGYAWVPFRVRDEQPEELAAALTEVAEQLVELIRHVSHTRPTLGTPIVTGFSQGGLLTWAAALVTDQVGLAMPLAAWVPPPLMPSGMAPDEPRPPPMRSMHGTEDRIVPIDPTRRVVAELRTIGYDVVLEEFEGVAHTMTPEMNALFESWLEEALRARAPNLGGGQGQDGPEEDAYEPYLQLSETSEEAPFHEAPPPDAPDPGPPPLNLSDLRQHRGDLRWTAVVLEYARSQGIRETRLVRGAPPRSAVDMSWYFIALVGFDRVVLVDCGTEQLLAEGSASLRRRWSVVRAHPIGEVLGRVGLTPADVSDVVLTHHHWDHVGALGQFDGATIHARPNEWRRVLALLRRPVEEAGRFSPLQEGVLFPGLTVREEGWHTPNQVTVQVDCAPPDSPGEPEADSPLAAAPESPIDTTAPESPIDSAPESPIDTTAPERPIDEASRFLFVGDAAYLYRSLDEGLPSAVTVDRRQNRALLARAVAEFGVRGVVPGHDPAVFSRFPSSIEGVGLLCGDPP